MEHLIPVDFYRITLILRDNQYAKNPEISKPPLRASTMTFFAAATCVGIVGMCFFAFRTKRESQPTQPALNFSAL